jgi:phosphoribosyl 1,2-cyclic phosphodiesterase
MVTINLSAAGAKEATSRLRKFLANDGISLKQTHAYEALAQTLGYANWNTLQALLSSSALPAVATTKSSAPVNVKFWGVRGSFPKPEHVIYGGQTSCVEVTWRDGALILDAGTGIRPLGADYLRRPSRSAVVLLSHCHWDHITGLQFFAPKDTEGWKIRVLAGDVAHQGGIRSVFAKTMTDPTCPWPLEKWAAEMSFEDFRVGEVLTDLAPGAVVRTAPLNHQNGATGYRIEVEGQVICYVTDTEHVPGKPDRNVLNLIKDADLVIYNANYTDEEFPSRIGWGHSTWQEGVRLCKAANAKRLALFHHDPDHDDAFMARLEDDAAEVWNGVVVARDNMVLEVGYPHV